MQTHARLSARHPVLQPEPSKPHAWSRRGKASHLRELALFEGLAPEFVRALEAVAQARAIDKGSVVFLPGDRPDRLYFLISGSVKVSRLTEDGKEFILELVGPGDSFGESAVFDASPRSTIAETLENSVLLSVPCSALRNVSTSSPSILLRIAERIGRRQEQLEKRLVDNAHKSARQRLADLLAQLGQSYGVRDARGTLLRIKLSQSALGNILGVSREVVNHSVSELRRRGVIDVAHGCVIIRNADALAAAAA